MSEQDAREALWRAIERRRRDERSRSLTLSELK